MPLDQPVKTPVFVKLYQFYFTTQKVTGDMRRGRRGAEEAHLNFAGLNYVWSLNRVRHGVIQSKALWGSKTRPPASMWSKWIIAQ